MNSASYEYRNKSARRGAHFVLMGMPIICWKTFPAKTTTMLSTRNSILIAKVCTEVFVISARFINKRNILTLGTRVKRARNGKVEVDNVIQVNVKIK